MKISVARRKFKNILVIKLRNIGDVLLCTPLIQRLRESFPQAKITALVNSGTEEMLTLNPDIDKVLVFDLNWKSFPLWKRVITEFKFVRRIYRARYDLVLNLTEGDRGALLSLVTRAPRRIGWNPNETGFWGKKHLFHDLVNPDVSQHMIEWNLMVLDPLGLERRLPAPRLFFDPRDAMHVENLLRKAGLRTGERTVHVHPTSRWLFKCWREERVARVIDHLYDQHGFRSVLTSSPDNKEMVRVRQIVRTAGRDPIDLSGQISLKQVAALTKRSLFFFGVDTAPMHIAGAVGTPVAAIFGPSNEEVWGPGGERDLIIKKDLDCRPCSRDGCDGSKISQCLEKLSVSEVIAELETWLKKSGLLQSTRSRER